MNRSTDWHKRQKRGKVLDRLNVDAYAYEAMASAGIHPSMAARLAMHPPQTVEESKLFMKGAPRSMLPYVEKFYESVNSLYKEEQELLRIKRKTQGFRCTHNDRLVTITLADKHCMPFVIDRGKTILITKYELRDEAEETFLAIGGAVKPANKLLALHHWASLISMKGRVNAYTVPHVDAAWKEYCSAVIHFRNMRMSILRSMVDTEKRRFA